MSRLGGVAVGLVVAFIVAFTPGSKRVFATAGSAARSQVDELYAAALAAGAKPDVEKARQLTRGGSRVTFRLRVSATQHLARGFILVSSTSDVLSSQTTWRADPVKPDEAHNIETNISRSYWIGHGESAVPYWSLVRADRQSFTTPKFLPIGVSDSKEEEQLFEFRQVDRNRALIRIQAVFGPGQGYLQYTDFRLQAGASSQAATVFIVE